MLVASIGAISGGWKEPELQPLLKRLIAIFDSGLCFSAVAWVVSVAVIQLLLVLKEDIASLGYTPETWRTWRDLKLVLRFWSAFALFSLIAILVGGARIAEALKGLPGH